MQLNGFINKYTPLHTILHRINHVLMDVIRMPYKHNWSFAVHFTDRMLQTPFQVNSSHRSTGISLYFFDDWRSKELKA